MTKPAKPAKVDTSSEYNPCTEDKRSAPHVRLWELLRRNEELRAVVKVMDERFSAYTPEDDAYDFGQAILRSVFAKDLDDLDKRLIEVLYWLSMDFDFEKLTIHHPLEDNLSVPWCDIDSVFRGIFIRLRGTEAIFNEDIFWFIWNFLLIKPLADSDVKKVFSNVVRYLEDTEKSHYLIAIPKTTLTTKERDHILSKINELIESQPTVHSTTFKDTLFGKKDDWKRYLAYERAYEEYLNEVGEPPITINDLKSIFYDATIIYLGKELGDTVKMSREVSTTRSAVKNIQSLIKNSFPGLRSFIERKFW